MDHGGTSPLQEQLDEMELLQAMSKPGEFEWTQDPLTGTCTYTCPVVVLCVFGWFSDMPTAGRISGTMNVSIQLEDSLKLNIVKGSPLTTQCLPNEPGVAASTS